MTTDRERALALAHELDKQFGVSFEYGIPAYLIAFYRRAVDDGLEMAEREAEHWQKISKSGHACGAYIAGAIHKLKEQL